MVFNYSLVIIKRCRPQCHSFKCLLIIIIIIFAFFRSLVFLVTYRELKKRKKKEKVESNSDHTTFCESPFFLFFCFPRLKLHHFLAAKICKMMCRGDRGRSQHAKSQHPTSVFCVRALLHAFIAFPQTFYCTLQ